MWRWFSAWMGLWAICSAGNGLAVTVESPGPKGATLALYDTGIGLVSEQRRVVLARGENLVRFLEIPVRIDPSSVSFSTVSGGRPIQVLDQRFEYDLTGVERLLQRYIGQTIEIRDGADVRQGVLLSAPAGNAGPSSIALLDAHGEACVYPDFHRLNQILFPHVDELTYVHPTLLARMTAQQDGPQNLRLNYILEGLSWNVSYEAIQTDSPSETYLGVRISLKNETGGAFKDARVRLVATEKGGVSEGGFAGSMTEDPQRYAYGREAPSREQVVASAAALQTYEMPGTITLENGAQLFVQLAQVEKLPVSRFYVYDGVKFDRFQRNRRNDWNYGTEFRKTIDTYLQFSNSTTEGLGFNLPPGRFRLYRQTESGALDLVGHDYIEGTPLGGSGYVALGPAKDLQGERERIGYSEIVPLHEYEESFEIRLENGSPENVEVRVVEHLYRWSDFEVVKSDAEYVLTAPQTIEFRIALKAGGKRAVHYTVHYRW
ncbi:MAG TPA: hypothetical protein DCZ95_04605 [Verrucomicrobia bacterium]|nr:hypothetical protein [Verrucomicrobiota bacterium]